MNKKVKINLIKLFIIANIIANYLIYETISKIETEPFLKYL